MRCCLYVRCPLTPIPPPPGFINENPPNPQKHIDWYTKLLGMKLLRFRDIPEGKYSNAFLGFNEEEQGFALEVRGGRGRGLQGARPLGPHGRPVLLGRLHARHWSKDPPQKHPRPKQHPRQPAAYVQLRG